MTGGLSKDSVRKGKTAHPRSQLTDVISVCFVECRGEMHRRGVPCLYVLQVPAHNLEGKESRFLNPPHCLSWPSCGLRRLLTGFSQK